MSNIRDQITDHNKLFTAQELQSAIYIPLLSDPVSNEAIGLTDKLFDICRNSVKATIKLKSAIGALLADLTKAARKSHSQCSYRPMSSESYSEHRLGYEVGWRAVDAFDRLGFIDLAKGYAGDGSARGYATRLRATPKLIELATQFGVMDGDWRDHFRVVPRPALVNRPLILKSSSAIVKGKKVQGKSMWFPVDDAKVVRIIRQVQELNTFFAGVAITPDDAHHGFHRIFSQGDIQGFDWNKGGRLYSIGGGYQNFKQLPDHKPDIPRSHLILNGEPVVEIDIKSSHLIILHALMGVPVASEERFYHIPGIPRKIAKGWVTMTLGYDKFQSRWSQAAKRSYGKRLAEEKYGKNYVEEQIDLKALQRDFPIDEVRERVLAHIPLLKDWPDSPIRWSDLQYQESCVVIDAVHALAMQRDIPALPVHDSIIVPVSKLEIAKHILGDTFYKKIGVYPTIDIK